MNINVTPGSLEEHNDDDSGCEDSMVHATRNQLKITVVPDITAGAGINNQDFDVKLSGEETVWFNELKGMYNTYKQKPMAKQQIKCILQKDDHPLTLALKLFAACPDCNNLKRNSLALFIMETVCEIYNNPPTDYTIQNTNCDDNTRMVAFNFIKTCGLVSLQKAVIKAYDLYKIKHLIIPKLQQLINQGHHKDVANWCILLDLTHLFGLYDLILPLMLQDRVSLAEDYLVKAKEQQLPTIQYLDSLLDKKKTVQEHCDGIIRKYNYNNIQFGFLTHRPMCKLVTRLVKKFQIDNQYIPNLEYSKSSSYLHYLFHKYKSDGMSLESWRELAHDEANKSKSLQLDLIAYIAQYEDNLEEALYWAKLYKIPLEEYPTSLQLHVQSESSNCKENHVGNITLLDSYTTPQKMEKEKCDCKSNGENKSLDDTYIILEDTVDNASVVSTYNYNAEEYLTLPLSMDKVIWVDNKEMFLQMLIYLETHYHIAFDAEWKPGAHHSEYGVALLQLSTRDRIYLIDCLSHKLDSNLWLLLGQKIFNNLEILKIGFSINQDIAMLHKSIPALQLSLQLLSGYLDLRSLWLCTKQKLNIKFPYENHNIKGEGLSALTELCFGKKLNKANQCSNWSKRPLRYDQVIYAALDAYCLISIYYVIAELLLQMNINIEEVVKEITLTKKTGCLNGRVKLSIDCTDNGKVTTVENCKYSDKQNIKKHNSENSEQKRMEQYSNCMKFLCDFMLNRLTTELRKLGLDCVQMFPVDDLNSYIDLAKREQYIVLSRGLHYHVFCRKLSQLQCLQIDEDTLDNQVVKLLQFLNIQISQKDLYSRCLKCNQKEFILATSNQLSYMYCGKASGHVWNNDNTIDVNYNTNLIQKQQQRSWILHSMDKNILKTKKTFYGKSIQLNDLNLKLIKSYQYYYICNNCGICTWDGDDNIKLNILSYVNHTTGGAFVNAYKNIQNY